MPGQSPTQRSIPLLALFLAWLVPGAGHMYLGRLTRGAIIFVTISATFWAGVAMGGVLTVDRDEERWWFVAEMFTGVYGLVGWQRQRAVARELADKPEIARATGAMERQMLIDRELAEQGIALVAPVATVARAYAGVAGLLNLMCAFDALLLSLLGVDGESRATGPPRGRRHGAKEAPL